MPNSISTKAIKMALIQTLSGMEFELAAIFDERLSSCEHVILKGFGGFDIIVLYETPSFEHDLIFNKPIKGILKANQFLCYLSASNDSKKMLDTLSRATFTAFSLLKIHPGVQHYIPQIEKNLTGFLNKRRRPITTHVLGTLGWNEIVLLMSGENIGNLLNLLFSTSMTKIGTDDESGAALLIKTFSFMGLSYEILRRLESHLKDKTAMKAVFDEKPLLRKKISKLYPPTISISCEPMDTALLGNYWNKAIYHVQTILGKNDLLVIPKKQISWSNFLSTLLHFRHSFPRQVVETSTCITHEQSKSDGKKTDRIPFEIPSKQYSFNYLKKIFGKNRASNISNHLLCLNSFTQNPVIGSAFQDMASYATNIVRIGKAFKKNIKKGSSEAKEKDRLIIKANEFCEVLRVGAELRSYGTWGTIEEVPGRFSALRGGTQRALLGIEFFPTHVFQKLGGIWQGFVIAEGHKFATTNDVLIVPPMALWNPQSWWALYHEIAHIWIDNVKPRWVGFNVEEIKCFMETKSKEENWLRFFTEISAEVLGFELGFYGNYELYNKLFWRYLKSIRSILKEPIPIDTYVVRTFFVSLFEKHFRREKVSADDFKDLDYLYENLLNHINWIEKTVNLKFHEKHFIAANAAQICGELYPFSQHLYREITRALPVRSMKSEINKDNTTAVTKSIIEGKIWWDKVNHPEAILYNLLIHPRLKFSQSIAAIITFWNCQMTYLRELSV